MDYLSEIKKYYKDSNSSEMSYRTPFQNFLESIFKKEDKYLIQHDQKAISGNKPDFIILKNNIPILYIEVKKVGEDLDKIEKSNQADRYFGYDNLIISDYVNFRFYRYGRKYDEEISLGNVDKNERNIISNNKEEILVKTILDFTNSHKEEIKSGKHLAEIMGGKALRIRENVSYMLSSQNEKFDEISKIKEVVRENLLNNIVDDDFADMYAQTLVYGLFASRYNDKTKDTFSRHEAIDLAPKTNPFLKRFFGHIAGESFPDRLRFIVDEICEVFTHADVHKLLTDFYGKEKENKDPVIHFYEDFLKEYDSKKKMDMGVFYTPKPVVDFIIRGVDYLLKENFNLVDGISSKEKIKIKKNVVDSKTGKEKIEEKEYHKVQILDIATGTGTFLNETIFHIYNHFKEKGQLGGWQSYVREHLLPRLHGFEIMMASYTIAHLKLGMTIEEQGIDTDKLNERLGIYLTNTLEETKDYSNQGTLFGFMDSIAEESKNASRIKKEYPIMCVVGNPPYSGESMNKEYTENDVYKVEIGGKEKLKERNSKWINDDYVKFIRFAESLIEKNGEGIVGMITAHGYIDNPTFRGMRWHLRNTFDKIYILDLHGNSNKKETSPDGSKDENVFDIKTGVSIIFGIKENKKQKEGLAIVHKADFYGKREEKFEKLNNQNIESIKWIKLPENSDIWVLEGQGKSEYMKGFSVAEIFPINSVGIVTSNDKILINSSREELLKNISDFYKIEPDINLIRKISYRPFDNKYLYYDSKIVERSRLEVMKHFINRENIGFIFRRAVHKDIYGLTFMVDKPIRADNYGDFSSLPQVAPLYIYENNQKIPNIDKEIWNKIDEKVGETTPENILDYIYAVLHSPSYRAKYKEFLKIDFPRVPYPEDKNKFFELVKIGEKLRGLHLMTDKSVNDFMTTFEYPGSNIVEKVKFEGHLKAHEKISGQPVNTKERDNIGDVWINDDQCFGEVPETAWNFYIGGYQPAQKYLKDRKGRNLTSDEIEHYQKIIKILDETNKIMKNIEL